MKVSILNSWHECNILSVSKESKPVIYTSSVKTGAHHQPSSSNSVSRRICSTASMLTLACWRVYGTASSGSLSWKKKEQNKTKTQSKAVPHTLVVSLYHLAFHLRRQRCPWFGKYKSRGKSAREHFTHRSFCYEPAALPSPDKVRDLSWTGYKK